MVLRVALPRMSSRGIDRRKHYLPVVMSKDDEGRKWTERERPFTSELPGTPWEAIQAGVMKTVYRGVPCLKSPFDLGLYLQLFSRLQPRTVIEIGTKYGGSALFFADMMDTHSGRGRVISIDRMPLADFSDPRISFLTGDARHLEQVLPAHLLDSLERPCLVVEDSSHFFESSMAVLEFFGDWLMAGEYMVIEDGIVSQLPGPQYAAYKDGPNRAVAAFLDRYLSHYIIDTDLCDHYGFNMTYNPNAWLRRL